MIRSGFVWVAAAGCLGGCTAGEYPAAQVSSPPTENASTQSQEESAMESVPETRGQGLPKTDAEWKEALTPEQYHVAREKGTERAFTGEYYLCDKQGVYRCVCCGEPLFTSAAKYHSGCGWPAFSRPVGPTHVDTAEDTSHGMVRTEVTCSHCGAHLGHVFNDGPGPSGLRYCINSVALKLDEEDRKTPDE